MSNLDRIQAVLTEYELDAMMVTGMSTRRYATGFPSSAGVTIVTKQGSYFFVDSRYIEAATNKITDAKVEMVSEKEGYEAKLNRVIAEHGIATIGIEEENMSYAEYLRYSGALKAKLIPCQKLLVKLRGSKTEAELEMMIAAQRIAEKALEEVLPLIKPGVTEREIASELTSRMRRLGAYGNSFDPIVVTGVNSSMPHGVPGDTQVKDGDFVTMDFGCTLNGYVSDMTRTVAVGHATDEMKKVYNTVLEAQLAGIAAAKAGVPGCDIDGAARKVITDAGYGEYFGHGFGHSLGMDVHEAPNANSANKEPMPVGAVISAEPGIYLPGRFGVRIEDVVYLRENDCINITKAPKELIIL